jgi:GWxTD domain-containing protein
MLLRSRFPRRRHAFAVLAGCLTPVVLAGCARRPPAPAAGAQSDPLRGTQVVEMQRIYQGMGLVAATGPLPFVASVSFLRGAREDSTLVLLALSFPARAVSFTRDGDGYVASYVVRLDLRQGVSVVRQVEARGTVRVQTFRETSRSDESVIWQQYLTLAPGRYTLSLGVRDAGAVRGAVEEVSLEVPRLTGGMLGTPVPVYEAIPRSTVDSLPRLLARPRSTVTFGVDSVLPVYLEAVGPAAPQVVTVSLVGDGGLPLWSRPFELDARDGVRSGVVPLPVGRMGIGVTSLVVAAPTGDTARTRIYVSLGDDLPIASFEEMLAYLRWFVLPERLRPLREAAPEARAEAWAEFLRSTDPVPGSAEHEGLRDYFQRIRLANLRFRDDGPIGWQTDRGTAYVALGDPDNIYDSGFNDPSGRARQQVWEYRDLRLQLVFTDQTGFGRWRLTASGAADLQNAIRRRLAQQNP